MSHLSVVVWASGRVVTSRLVPLVDGLPLGAHPGSPVPFPHATVWVERRGETWTVASLELPADRPLRLPVGPFDVEVTRVQRTGWTPSTAWLSRHRSGVALWWVTVALSVLAAQAHALWRAWEGFVAAP